uniref:Citramalyl-CoA lyase, mitochondrial n=1 Tax=Angiostrongylus cantonensis TaxID=6313 RepID=A0A158PAH0_ANGCA
MRRIAISSWRLSSQFAGVKDRVKYIPRRSLLYVPASSQKMLDKVPSIQADCVVLELEDGVAFTSKALARRQAADALNKLLRQQLHCFELGLRVNSVSSGLMEDDVKEVCKAGSLPQAFMIPKVDTPEDVATIYDIFRSNYTPKRVTDTSTRLVIWIESARALLDMPRILSSTLSLHKNSGFFKLDAVVFGSDDYCADIGATRSSEGKEVIYARQRFITCCKAFQLQAIDSVFIDIKDIDGLRRQCIEGHSWGFTGKQSIHPTQVPVIQEAFLPSADKVEWATELAHAFSQHQIEGKGAFQFRGQMIDRPLLLQAMNIIQLVERVGVEISSVSK